MTSLAVVPANAGTTIESHAFKWDSLEPAAAYSAAVRAAASGS
jgi:hypothetical protein